jgi:hypothetical protein
MLNNLYLYNQVSMSYSMMHLSKEVTSRTQFQETDRQEL